MTEPLADSTTVKLERVVAERLADWPKQWEGFHWPGYTHEHTSRVRALARALAATEGADLVVVDLAALLHDIAKPQGAEHARLGAAEAAALLHSHGLDPHLVDRVHDAIATHSGDNTPTHPVENRVLGDADLIDANFGLVATWRFITIRAGRGSTVVETVTGFADWLPRKDELMHLLRSEAGRAVAHERSVVMRGFCEQVAAAYHNGEHPALRQLVELISDEHERASLSAQIALARALLAQDALLDSALQRLEAEVSGGA
jgi:uncharacterized protein